MTSTDNKIHFTKKDRPLVLVSVLVITYNHVQYIAQALDKVLAQKTNFHYEILLGEDGSTDGTRELCINYKNKHSNQIVLFLNDRKNVIYINSRPSGRWNFTNLLKNAKGKYIALIEGDDYWIDPLKLQKQVDFLEGNSDFSICFHSIQIIDEVNSKKNRVTQLQINETTTIEDLCKGNYIYTASCVFRNGLIREFPNWFYKCSVGDWPLYLMNAEHGKIKFLNEVMSVYRKHIGGTWSQLEISKLIEQNIKTIYLCNNHFNGKYKFFFFQRLVIAHINLLKLIPPIRIFNSIYYSFKLLILLKYNKNAITRKQIMMNFILGQKKQIKHSQ